MSTLQVRRLAAHGYDPVPTNFISVMCERAIHILDSQGLTAMESYRVYKMSADDFVRRRGGVAYINGDELIERYSGADDMHLFLTPPGTVLVVGQNSGTGARECGGYGENDVAIVPLEPAIFDSYSFGSEPRPLLKPMNSILHEYGHAHYRLRHHKSKSKVCAMSTWHDRALRYCGRCQAQARKIDRKRLHNAGL